MKSRNFVFIFAFLFIAYTAFSQNSKSYFQIANDYFDNGDYKNAVVYYEKNLADEKTTYGLNHIYIGNDYFLIGVCYSKVGKYDEAISNLKKALEIFESSKIQSNESDSETKEEAAKFASDTVLEIGNAYFGRSDYDTALEYYQKCLSLRKNIFGENHTDTAACYVNIGLIYDFKCDYKTALSYFQKALAIRQKMFGENHLETADSYHDIAAENYYLGNYKEAREYWFKALKIREEIAGTNSYEVAHTLGAIATLFIDTEWYEDALWANDRAEQIYAELMEPMSSDFQVLYNEKGRIYEKLGDYGKALQYYGKSLEIAQKIYGEKHVNTAKEYLNIGGMYQAMGDYSRAIANIEKSLEIEHAIFGDSHLDIARCYFYIGGVYRSKGEFDTALPYFNKALDMYKKLLGEKHIDVARCYLEIGGVYDNKNDYQTAIDYYRKANNIVYEIFGYETKTIAQAYDRIANIYNRWGYYEDAESLYKAALTVYTERCGENSIDAAMAYSSLGWHYAGQYDVQQTVESFRKAYEGFRNATNYNQVITCLNLILKDAKQFRYDTDTSFIRDTIALAIDTVERARLDMSSIKSDILRKSLPVYYYGVDFEARNGNPAKAFEYSEALRSRGFLDDVGLERAVSLDGITESERKQIKELTSKIVFARKEIENQNNLELKDRDTQKFTQAEKDLAVAEKSLAKLDASIGKRLPQYAQLRNPQAVSAKVAQKWCGNDRAILEYVFQNQDMAADVNSENGQESELKSYCLVITKQNVTAVPLDGGFDYAVAVTKLRENVIPKNARAKPTPEVVFEDVRNELYEKLIEPVMPYIKGKGRLLIVPDGCLSFLPFDILRKSENAKMLCERYAVSLSPSVSVSMISGVFRAKGMSMLAFGGAWYDSELSVEEHRRTFSESDTNRGKKRGFQAVSFDLEIENEAQKSFIFQNIQANGPSEYFRQKNLRWMDLPGTIAELNVLKEDVFEKNRYEQYIYEDAAEHTVKQLSKNGVLATYPVLHFACHGYFDKSIATMSSILFSEVSGKLNGVSSDDGYLTIPEVSLLNLDADLVCLSACETGLGEVRVGDGMVGLNRAFMVAGARRVGVTLWSVDDGATAEFMASMYKKVERNGMDYEQAYRRTKAEFQKSEEYSHPYYWAAFALYE